MMRSRLWVDGWLSQLLLLGMTAVAIWFGLGQQAATYVVGSAVIGVMRQIERSRREREAVSDDPPPGSKV